METAPVFFILGLGVSLMTAFYMFRVLFLTFFGEFRGTDEQRHHLHESPPIMTIPLILVILPTLFVVILGPAACSIADSSIGGGGK